MSTASIVGLVARSCGVFLFSAAVTAAGCSGRMAVGRVGPAYEAAPNRLGSLQLQVVSLGNAVELTNTTARRFDRCRLWLNAWYSADIEGGLGVGERIRVPLWAFADEQGRSLRSGGFFASNSPDRLSLAELETPEGFYGLLFVDP